MGHSFVFCLVANTIKEHRWFFNIKFISEGWYATHYHSRSLKNVGINGDAIECDIWVDAAGADSVMTAYEKFGKYNSRMVLVAVGTNKREIDVLGLTFGQKSIIGSGGYSHEDVMDVMKIMKSKKWDIEKLITHEYHLEELSKAIEKAADVDNALNVIIKFEI